MNGEDTQLILIRHAQSEWNAAGRWQGLGDPPLSALGREQAQALAAKLASESVDQFFCSDLQRARQTAAPLAEHWGLEPTLDLRLRELDIGGWTGLTREQIELRDAGLLAEFDSLDPEVRPGGGENRAELRARAAELVFEWGVRCPGERIAIVTHMGFVRALLPDVTLGNAEYTVVAAADASTRRARMDARSAATANGSRADRSVEPVANEGESPEGSL